MWPNSSFIVATRGEPHSSLIGVASTDFPGRIRVVPGDPDASFLYLKLNGDLGDSDGAGMPFGSFPLDDGIVNSVKAWIEAGAPND